MDFEKDLKQISIFLLVGLVITILLYGVGYIFEIPLLMLSHTKVVNDLEMHSSSTLPALIGFGFSGFCYYSVKKRSKK